MGRAAHRSVTTDGKPSGTKATKTDTANVTVVAACPLYTVPIPTPKNRTAKKIAMNDIVNTNWALARCVKLGRTASLWGHRHFRSERALIATFTASKLGNLTLTGVNHAHEYCDDKTVLPMNVWSPVRTTTVVGRKTWW